jgi:hypothetical protein
MNGHPQHPGTEELAEFQAGITEAARGDQIAAHTAECPECAAVSEELGQVPAILASIPPPAMPGDLEGRIMAALAAEAARPAPEVTAPAAPAAASPDASSPPVPLASASPSASPTPLSPTVLPTASLSPASTRRRRRRQSVTAPLGVLVAAAACLMLAFVGYRLSATGHPASSSVAAGGASSHSAGSPPATGPHRDNLSPTGGAMVPASTTPFVFLVTSTNFRKSTLQAQVTQQLNAESKGPVSSGGTFQPGGQGSSGALPGRQAIPPKPLVGCVTSLLGQTKPALVEQATYQSLPVYMIAVTDRAWVVSRDCTAANSLILASVALPARS